MTGSQQPFSVPGSDAQGNPALAVAALTLARPSENQENPLQRIYPVFRRPDHLSKWGRCIFSFAFTDETEQPAANCLPYPSGWPDS
ncbi:hypothetical protein [Neisseria leonii]|uniref:hypothetical protein n=1 Tax=Neisseria leonii TaxID=2995413 RepID=UPI00237B274B|nr:hypothetical protein [Neisseria sp. 3986]MDD9324835.1 hypothetical protein [Neisseria sp. 3986]